MSVAVAGQTDSPSAAVGIVAAGCIAVRVGPRIGFDGTATRLEMVQNSYGNLYS